MTLTRAQLPGRNRATWLKAVPYALEEQLADDVEELHFALGRGGPQPTVATVAREDLEEWLAICNAAAIQPVAVVPEPLLLPLEEGRWSILATGQGAVVRTDSEAGFACELSTLPLLLELALAEAGENPPPGLTVWGELPADPPQGLEIHHHPLPPDPLALLGDYQPGQTLNLLQGPYSRQAQLGKWLRPWRVAAVLGALWLTLGLVFQLAEYIQLSRERTRLEAEITQVFRQALPDTRVVNPRVQMEQRLRTLARGESGSAAGFLELLYRGGQTLIAFEDIALKGLRYRNDRLDLDLEGGSLETFDRLKQSLGQQPGMETQMRTSRRDDRIQSQVTLRVAS